MIKLLKMFVCYFIAWSWHLLLYLMIILGIKTNITWLYSLGISIYGILWLPFCNENIFQIPLAILLYKKLFKSDDFSLENIKKGIYNLIIRELHLPFTRKYLIVTLMALIVICVFLWEMKELIFLQIWQTMKKWH